jgi:hypothetical protein
VRARLYASMTPGGTGDGKAEILRDAGHGDHDCRDVEQRQERAETKRERDQVRSPLRYLGCAIVYAVPPMAGIEGRSKINARSTSVATSAVRSSMPMAAHTPVLLTAWCQQDLIRRLESSECPVGGGPRQAATAATICARLPSGSKWTRKRFARSWPPHAQCAEMARHGR